ncbi:MAG: lysylphosphatidylglycerol synthase transmembrane domain-containing protein [Acidobacteriota bacterium]|nr:lysylphosphatidylglycerol synthase transmembrane domain-containing protein [Acidobacteriota bacterium]
MRPRFSALNIIVAIVGAALLFYTIRRVGWSDVVAGVASVGWWFALVVILGASRMAFRARAWMVAANSGSEQLTFGQAFGAMLAADAAGNLTPLGLLASEPTKILMTRARITTVTSVASVAIENAFYIASVAVVLLTGTWFFFQRAEVPPALQYVAQFIVVGVALIGVVGLWAARSQPAILSNLAPLVTRLAGKSAVPADAVREVESRIYGVLQWPIAQIGRVVGWETAFHVAAVAEVWLVLRHLPGGGGTTLVDAFLMESAGRFVTIAFKFIPYRLGIDEAGSGAVAQVLGLNPVTGVTLALVRRLRIMFLNVFGLIRLARQ